MLSQQISLQQQRLCRFLKLPQLNLTDAAQQIEVLSSVTATQWIVVIRNAFQGEQPNFETLGLHIQPSQHGLGIGSLQQHGGNISATARALNMHRRTLQRKLQKRPTNRLS